MLNFCNNTKKILFYASINEIPTETWEELNCKSNLYFSPEYLISLEKNNPQISFFYIVLVDENQKPIAFSSIQIVDFLIDTHPNNTNNYIENLKKIVRKFLFPEEKPFKILVCGNTFVSGEHGIFIKKNQDKKKVVKELTKGILRLVNSDENFSKIEDRFLSAFSFSNFILADFSAGINLLSFVIRSIIRVLSLSIPLVFSL